MKQWFVYILASARNGTLYIGITNNLARRVSEHQSGADEGFTNRYQVHGLVYYESFDSPEHAIQREKNMKAWQRAWKIRLIEEYNPDWKDLSNELLV
jgi:putative endonuclease